jgi:hypothetical protein
MKKNLLVLAVLIFGITAANAQTATHNIAKRQHNQQVRIKEGVRHGELSRSETVRLEKQQHHIQQEKHVAKRDGSFTPAERGHIRHEQIAAGHNIYRKRHNAVTR